MIGWFEETVLDGVTIDLPGLYCWEIEGVGVYIGKFTRARRPRREYFLNVEKIITGRPYRKSKSEGFRFIYHALAQAKLDGVVVKLIILENPPLHQINLRERELIAMIPSELRLNRQ